MARLAAYRFEWVLPGHGQRVHLPAAEMRQQIERLAKSMGIRTSSDPHAVQALPPLAHESG
jgi:hypothetical protein